MNPFRILDQLRRRLLTWRRRLQERAELQRLSDRDLRDIGLTRIDAEAARRIPFWRA